MKRAVADEREQESRWRLLDATILVLGVAALLAGAVLLLAAHPFAAVIAGIALVGLGGIALVSLAFLLVGQSEERDRRRNPRG